MGPTDFSPKQLPLPKSWPEAVGAAILHAISVAHLVITYARGWAANSMNARVRQAAEIDRLQQEVALLPAPFWPPLSAQGSVDHFTGR